MEKKVIISNLGLIGVVRWLNETYSQKKTGAKFTVSDVQGYMMRKQIPNYLGGYRLEEKKSPHSNRLWDIVEIKS